MSSKATFRHYGVSKPIVERKKYFLWHMPKAVVQLLDVKANDQIDVFISTNTREILLKLRKGDK
jgi:hypothetical protein